MCHVSPVSNLNAERSSNLCALGFTLLGGVPTTPTLILLKKHRDTNGRCTVIPLGGVYTTFCQAEGILLQKYRDRNGRCIAILFKSIGARGRCDHKSLQLLTVAGHAWKSWLAVPNELHLQGALGSMCTVELNALGVVTLELKLLKECILELTGCKFSEFPGVEASLRAHALVILMLSGALSCFSALWSSLGREVQGMYLHRKFEIFEIQSWIAET